VERPPSGVSPGINGLSESTINNITRPAAASSTVTRGHSTSETNGYEQQYQLANSHMGLTSIHEAQTNTEDTPGWLPALAAPPGVEQPPSSVSPGTYNIGESIPSMDTGTSALIVPLFKDGEETERSSKDLSKRVTSNRAMNDQNKQLPLRILLILGDNVVMT
jgi:hypothetical protein